MTEEPSDQPADLFTILRAILTELQAIRGILAVQAMENIPDPEYPRID